MQVIVQTIVVLEGAPDNSVSVKWQVAYVDNSKIAFAALLDLLLHGGFWNGAEKGQ